MDQSIMHKLTYGMYIIGAAEEGKLNGCTANTCMQITSVDPVFAISLNQVNLTYEMIRRTGKFSVSILSEETPARVISEFGYFSGRDRDKFDSVSYHIVEGLPVLTESICGALLFDVVSIQEMETHAVIFGRLKDTVAGTASVPMSYEYYHKVLKGKASKNAPTYLETEEPEQPSSDRYVCDICGYVYEGDITEEPDDFICPICGVGKDHFMKEVLSEPASAERYICEVCGYVYEGDLTKEPDDFVCPICGVGKENFRREGGDAPEAEERYVCDICGYVYEGDLTKEPNNFVCPICGVSKEHFMKQ